LKGKKVLSTIHFKKLSLGEEFGEQTRVSAGNPFGTSDSAVKTICPSRGISDSAVKLSALAVEVEKPFRVLICRDWYRDSKNSIVRVLGWLEEAKLLHCSSILIEFLM
jgi:hypothetical protein